MKKFWYETACSNCTQLGRLETRKGNYDLYFHERPGHHTRLIAKFGNDEDAMFTSSVNKVEPSIPLLTAKILYGEYRQDELSRKVAEEKRRSRSEVIESDKGQKS